MKIKVIIETIYETNPEWYPENISPLEMVNIDLENDAGMFLSDCDIKILSAEEV